MNLLDDLRAEILLHLPVPDVTARDYLAAQTTANLLVYFFNWIERLVHAHPRQVHRSRKLISHPEYETNKADIDTICDAVAAGSDICSHLSERVLCGYQAPNNNKKLVRHIDDLLNDWGVHHLHISNEPWKGKFTKRTKSLLAVIFEKDAAYFIDIITHQSWAQLSIVETVVSEWPNANLFLKVPMLASRTHWDADKQTQLRQDGISSPVVLNNEVYISKRGGITAARTPVRATQNASIVLRQIASISSNPDEIYAQFAVQPDFVRDKWPATPSLRVTTISSPEGYDFAIREEKSGLLLRFAKV